MTGAELRSEVWRYDMVYEASGLDDIGVLDMDGLLISRLACTGVFSSRASAYALFASALLRATFSQPGSFTTLYVLEIESLALFFTKK